MNNAALLVADFWINITKHCEFLEDCFDNFLLLVLVEKTHCEDINKLSAILEIKGEYVKGYDSLSEFLSKLATTDSCLVLNNLKESAENFQRIICSASNYEKNIEGIFKKLQCFESHRHNLPINSKKNINRILNILK